MQVSGINTSSIGIRLLHPWIYDIRFSRTKNLEDYIDKLDDDIHDVIFRDKYGMGMYSGVLLFVLIPLSIALYFSTYATIGAISTLSIAAATGLTLFIVVTNPRKKLQNLK